MDNIAIPTAKIAYIPFDGVSFLRHSMKKSKGCAYGADAWNAYQGLYSQALNGGMLPELSATTAVHTAEFHALKAGELSAAGKAFVKLADQVKAYRATVGKPKTQEAHDVALLHISAMWAGCFKDAAPRVKSTEPTAKQVIDTLQAELHAMVIERDHALSLLAACQKALVDATAQAVTT